MLLIFTFVFKGVLVFLLRHHLFSAKNLLHFGNEGWGLGQADHDYDQGLEHPDDFGGTPKARIMVVMV